MNKLENATNGLQSNIYTQSSFNLFQSEAENIFAYSTCNSAKSWTPWSHNKSVILQLHNMWLWALECTGL